jgi:cellulose synthase operon protein C
LLPKLRALLDDVDESVAANAAAAYGRASRHTSPERVAEVLCPLVNDERPYVRANALTSLASLKLGCARSAALDRLSHDRSRIVRARAARALGTLNATAPDATVSQALDRCAQTDTSSAVAFECERAPTPNRPLARDAAAWATIFVVPAGSVEPVAEAPFALALPSGWVRLGFADRRGAVFEASEQGALWLEVAAGGAE